MIDEKTAGVISLSNGIIFSLKSVLRDPEGFTEFIGSLRDSKILIMTQMDTSSAAQALKDAGLDAYCDRLFSGEEGTESELDLCLRALAEPRAWLGVENAEEMLISAIFYDVLDVVGFYHQFGQDSMTREATLGRSNTFFSDLKLAANLICAEVLLTLLLTEDGDGGCADGKSNFK